MDRQVALIGKVSSHKQIDSSCWACFNTLLLDSGSGMWPRIPGPHPDVLEDGCLGFAIRLYMSDAFLDIEACRLWAE